MSAFTYLDRPFPPSLRQVEPRWLRDEVSGLDAARAPLPEQWMQDLADRFHAVPLFLRIDACSFYMWHTDRRRRCALNYELTPGGCVLFGEPGFRGSFTSLQQVDYSGRWALLDTTRWHCVINPGGARVVFSLGFNDHTYEEVRQHLLSCSGH